MDINEIQRRVTLLKTVTRVQSVLVKDVAKELKVSQTDLMQFILDNPKLFHTEEVWSLKKVSYKQMMPWGPVRQTRTVRDKCRGLGIARVFLTPKENYRTDEYVAFHRKQDAKTVWLTEWNNYGTIEGHYIKEDEKNEKDESRKHLWRNTADKIAELQILGILKKGSFFYGTFGDCAEHKLDTVIDDEGIAKAERLGWKIIR